MAYKRKTDGTMTVSAMGRKGGQTTAKRHGKEHYIAIGHKGGTANAAVHDSEHFVKIGKMGGAAVRRLIAQAKAATASQR